MKFKNTFLSLLLSLFSIGGVQAAGSPMHEDFTQIITLSEKAIATGKLGNAEAFAVDTEAAFKQAKEQNTVANSPAIQRIASKLRTAMNLAKSGKIAEGTASIEEAVATMKEAPKPVKFGGGS